MTTYAKTEYWSSNMNYQAVTLDGSDGSLLLNVASQASDENSPSSIYYASSITSSGDVTVAGGTSLTVYGDVKVTGSLNIDDENVTVGGTVSGGAVTISGGATLKTGYVTSTIIFGTSPTNSSASNTLIVTNYSEIINIENLSPRDVIEFDNGETTSLSVKGNTLVDQTGAVVANVTFASGYSASDFSFSGDTATVTCYLRDTAINTTRGNVAVQDIALGDHVLAYAGDATSSRRVVWAGRASCIVDSSLPDDLAGYPVRILKDAISAGAPFKDMLVTAEHCLLLEGKFIPVRMLVNGRSIFYDKTIASYDYYHIETEDHSVIMADGVLTESYLDTGNRSSFRQTGKVVSIGGSRKLSWNDAAAPLDVTRAFVEPLFREILDRSESLGCPVVNEGSPLSYDTDLHLITESGAIIRKISETDGRSVFVIPNGVNELRIVSNASRPSDVIGPYVDDRRYFGVAVGEVMLHEGRRSRSVVEHLSLVDLDGWNALEAETGRWTTGDALLPLGERNWPYAALLSVQIIAAGPYALDTQGFMKDQRRA